MRQAKRYNASNSKESLILSDSGKMQRIISFANSTVSIDYAGGELAELVDFLFRWLPISDAEMPQTRILLTRDEADAYCLLRDGVLFYKEHNKALVAERLLGELSYQLADKSSGGLVFHAAAVAWQDQGILLPGASGAGKSTLTCWLLNNGFTYLTDELVFIPHQSTIIHALTRPINLKKSSRKILRNIIDYESHADQILSSSYSDLTPSFLLGSSAPCGSASLHSIIFPHYQPGSHLEWQKLTPAQTGLALMKCLVNARNLPRHGLDQVAHVTRNAEAYSLTYTHFDQLGEQISRIRESNPTLCATNRPK